MKHFLIIYSHSRQSLLAAPKVFPDSDVESATGAYQEAEVEYRDVPDVEIVLIGADSIDTVRHTHGHYFDADTDRLARYLSPA